MREHLTMDTHIGQNLYQPTRVQFGVHSEEDTFVQIDDTLITKRNGKEHINLIQHYQFYRNMK